MIGEYKLRAAMLAYARNVFLISIVLSLITAVLIFVSINRIMIRPIRRLTLGMQRFSEDPENPAGIFVPEDGNDELSVAGRHLADMQTQLHKTLRQQKNLADLGLAVSKINHDMRNILSSAQLMSDRLVDAKDPIVEASRRSCCGLSTVPWPIRGGPCLWSGDRGRTTAQNEQSQRAGAGCSRHPGD